MAFCQINQNFPIGTRVRIGNTTQATLDGVTGIIGGIAAEHICSSYIVILDQPLSYNGWLAISITEACLEPE